MKKTLLLSVVASGLLFAGGDIAPAQPEVVTPAPVVEPAQVVESGWKFNGQGVVAYGTTDIVDYDLFDQDSSWANAGVSLKAENTDVIGGLGLGVKLVGLGTLGLEEDVVSGAFQTADGNLNGGAITELYATYGIGNTSIKLGRQELPKALSPLAFSEHTFNALFANTYGAALVVNTDIANTVLVGAWVQNANSGANLGDFNKLNGGDGVYMITAQNKSVSNLTLTGSIYYAPDLLVTDDFKAFWGDAAFDIAGLNAGIQAGVLDYGDNTIAFGGKIGGKADIISYSLAVTDVNDEGLGVINTGPILSGGFVTDNALYTTLENNAIFNYLDSTTYMAKIGADVLGGNLSLAGAYSDLGSVWGTRGSFTEADLAYTTKVGPLDLTAMYIYSDSDFVDFNTLKVKAVYNF